MVFLPSQSSLLDFFSPEVERCAREDKRETNFGRPTTLRRGSPSALAVSCTHPLTFVPVASVSAGLPLSVLIPFARTFFIDSLPTRAYLISKHPIRVLAPALPAVNKIFIYGIYYLFIFSSSLFDLKKK